MIAKIVIGKKVVWVLQVTVWSFMISKKCWTCCLCVLPSVSFRVDKEKSLLVASY
jgi:hypothetical protein